MVNNNHMVNRKTNTENMTVKLSLLLWNGMGYCRDIVAMSGSHLCLRSMLAANDRGEDGKEYVMQ